MSKVIKFFKEYPRFGIAALVAIIALGFDIAGAQTPVLRTIAHWMLAAEALVMAALLAKGMFEDLQEGRYGVDILAVTAIVTSVLLKEYWTAMITVIMLTGGEALEDYAEDRAKTELTALLSRAPTKAHLIKGTKVTDVPIKQVKAGDKLSIKTGEVVPVDCEVLEGTSSLDESSLTGESLPVAKKPGDSLLSGSINMDGALVVRATQTAENSQFEQIIKLVRSAATNQAPFVRLADRYSVPFTFISFVIAGSLWAATGDPMRFLQILVVATPCPLLLGAPIGLISGMSRAAKHGIIIKNGASLEKLAALKSIAFDKTGTLTHGQPVIDTIKTYHGHNKSDVLAAAASLEQNSTHILANVIVAAAKKADARIAKAVGINEVPGYGLQGKVNGKVVHVGKMAYFEDEAIELPKDVATSDTTTALVAIDGKLAGAITFQDEIRATSKKTVLRLRKSGIQHIMMLTGDNQTTAARIAKEVGITDISANCLPADKVKAVKHASAKHKPIAMVGDGVNDAPVLTAADVGIALGARGSTAASESADVVIMLDDITKVAEAREIAKRTFFITKQSILLGIGLSFVLMAIFATGKFAPVYGAAAQEIVDVFVIINALRAHIDRKTS